MPKKKLVILTPAEMGRRGGQASGGAKAEAARANIRKAIAKRWPKKRDA